ncbi:MAG: amino acid permease [Ignavibacteriaceae bacterium]|nr:amino acid permease [Ignavibacteriaceae bacterium]NUM69844.1 amino acid permease [Ignavibacteriaceae bacterium]
MKKYNLYTATAIAMSTMIGTGVFTSIGFQVIDIKSTPAILALWILGGIIAIAGALTYGELASTFPKSGGEYNFLSKLYHPVLGFLSGYTSATVGFAAPIALAAMALGSYLTPLFPGAADFNPAQKEQYRVIIACTAVVILTVVHLLNMKTSGNFQKYITSLVVLLIGGLIVAAFIVAEPVKMSFEGISNDLNYLISNAFAVSLIYVSYSYSGWNAAAYITEDIENPKRNVPRALIFGTLIVMTLYVLLNFVFLYTVPIDQLAGQIEIGYLAAKNIFGETGGIVISLLISVCLVSAISGMTLVGPRITQTIFRDILPNIFAKYKSISGEVPVALLLFQTAVSIFLIITYTFEQVLVYIGFTLSLFTTLTVTGIFISRKKFSNEGHYKTPLYPITPILFIIFEIWMLSHLLSNKFTESVAGLLTVCSGIPVYYLAIKLNQKLKSKSE